MYRLRPRVSFTHAQTSTKTFVRTPRVCIGRFHVPRSVGSISELWKTGSLWSCWLYWRLLFARQRLLRVSVQRDVSATSRRGLSTALHAVCSPFQTPSTAPGRESLKCKYIRACYPDAHAHYHASPTHFYSADIWSRIRSSAYQHVLSHKYCNWKNCKYPSKHSYHVEYGSIIILQVSLW